MRWLVFKTCKVHYQNYQLIDRTRFPLATKMGTEPDLVVVLEVNIASIKSNALILSI